MPATRKREGREPKEGSRFIGQVLAENVRACRLLRRLSQGDLAERMRALGHERWVRATSSEVERYGRNVSVDELLSLALALETTIGTLIEPSGVDGRQQTDIDVGLDWTVPVQLFTGLAFGVSSQAIAWHGNAPGGFTGASNFNSWKAAGRPGIKEEKS